MIENDLEKADGELHAMLADMVNKPLVAALQHGNGVLLTQVVESIQTESATTVRQVRNELKRAFDDIGEIGSNIRRAQNETAAAKLDTDMRLAEISSGVQAVAHLIEPLPSRICEAVSSDFADVVRRLDQLKVSLKAAGDATKQASDSAYQNLLVRLEEMELQRMSGQEAAMRSLRSLRRLIKILLGCAVVGLSGMVAILVHAYG